MNKLKLIIQHEYMTIVGKKSFIIMTILIPFLLILLLFVPIMMKYINDKTDSTEMRIAVVDKSHNYGGAFKDNGKYRFELMSGDSMDKTYDIYKKASGRVDAIMEIPEDVLERQQVELFSEKTLDESTVMYLNQCLTDTLRNAKIASLGGPELADKMAQAQVNPVIKSKKWNENGEEQEQSATIASIIGIILAFLTYTFVLSYGAMIMNSVVEEKTNRIVEVIVSSCKPMELMMGKIIGVGLVGLTQFAIWVVLLGIAMGSLGLMGIGADTTSSADAMAMGMNVPESDSTIASLMAAFTSINWFSLLGNFILYFIGGYLLYASLFAGFGSAVDQASDSSQFTMPIILIMMVALYAGIGCMSNPNGPMAVWCSMIPFTSPVVMMVRLPFDVPWWQLLLSIVLLFGTALLCIWISARIYRTGILLYGKKRSFKEVLKWIK
ncbi:MAG: ABC transporter permease [Muribaculaceae bacterium]|nr:ABC transporter permease [Muribaculaceae bacterium]